MRNSTEISLIIRPYEQGPLLPRQSERRREPRYPYRVTQLAAFHEASQKATKEMFQPVRCHDISLGGISFFLAGPPKTEHCTLVLGRPPALIYVRAQILHSEPTEDSPDTWIIGCQFVERLSAFPLSPV